MDAVDQRIQSKLVLAKQGQERLERFAWKHDFSFFGFGEEAPLMSRFYVYVNAESNQYRISLEFKTAGWDMLFSFCAYQLPVPYTTKYYLHIARNPTRFKFTLEDSHSSWKCLLSFYSYSARKKDQYKWIQKEDRWLMQRNI